MRKFVSRVILSGLVVPLAMGVGEALVEMSTSSAHGRRTMSTRAVTVSTTIGCLLMLLALTALWFKSVRWSRGRILGMVFLAAECVWVPWVISEMISRADLAYYEPAFQLHMAFTLTLPFQMIVCWHASRKEELASTPSWRRWPERHCGRCLAVLDAGRKDLCPRCAAAAAGERAERSQA